ALDAGEKAEDAVDYEDIEDDDLPEEELGFTADGITAAKGTETDNDWDIMQGLLEGELSGPPVGGDELDDLFGDAPSSPMGEMVGQSNDSSLIFKEDRRGGLSTTALDVASTAKTPVGSVIARERDDHTL